MRRNAVPELGLRTRDDLMRLRQLLNVGDPDDQGIMKELHGAVLQHVQDDLGVLRVVLVPAVVQGLARSSQADRRDELQLESGLAGMMCQRPVIGAGGLRPEQQYSTRLLNLLSMPFWRSRSPPVIGHRSRSTR